MSWDENKHIFKLDGSLRDLYILNTIISDWQNLLDYLQASNYSISFTVNDMTSSTIFKSAQWIFINRAEIGILLAIELENIQINCHFFTENEIEFDINPKEIESEKDYIVLKTFMQKTSNHLAKKIILTTENYPDFVLLIVTPELT